MAERAVWAVSTSSWHGKMYAFWKENSKFKNGAAYRENLCHYCRVILIWAPISMFAFYEVLGMPPWAWLFLGTLFAGITYAIVTSPLTSTLSVIGVIVGCCAAIALFEFIYNRFKEPINRGINAFGQFTFKYMLTPIGWCFMKFWMGLCWTGRKIRKGFKFFSPQTNWVDERTEPMRQHQTSINGNEYNTVYIVFLGLMVATYSYAFSWFWLAMVPVMIALAAYLPQIGNKLRKKGKLSRAKKREDGNPTFASVGYDYAKAKKHKICPLIEVE